MAENRVEYQEDVKESVERIPFLRQFLYIDKDDLVFCTVPFDRIKINKYMGFELIKKFEALESVSINKVLKKAEKRGDI